MAQWLINGKPISQYASYAAMFCPLHSSISIKQHKSTSAIHPAITENAKDSHILMHKSRNALILAILNSFHNITAVRSVSAIFVSCTEAITR